MNNLRQMHQRLNKVMKHMSPNPNVAAPHVDVLPANNSPELRPSAVAISTPPAMGTERFLRAAAKVMTRSWGDKMFVWLPAISTDPNAGPTYGIMPVLVMADQNSHRIRQLLAPSYTYNEIFGQTGTARYYLYPTASSQLYANASYSQHVNRELKLRYVNPALDDGIFYIRGEAYYSADASNRFYGLGPASREGDQTGYVSRTDAGDAAFGFNFGGSWRTTVGLRVRHLATDTNVVPDIGDLAQRFPNVPGIGSENTVAGQFRLLWDTRDSPVTPSKGSSGEFFAENTSGDLGSDADFVRYGFEGKRLFPWSNPKETTVVRGLYEWVNGPNIPFYELSSVGGRDTLRGFGDGRFLDRGRLAFNAEQRHVLTSFPVMGVQTNFEVAAFFDLGTVFPTLPQMEYKYLYPVLGGAFRAAVKPNVVGDVEVGVGREGPAVFVDINYPF